MTVRKMHEDEVMTDVSLVRRLLAAQFPQWAELSITPVPSSGTDNAMYRLGDDMAVRMPRIHWAVEGVEKEQRWLPWLAPHLPVAIPAPLGLGTPAEGYPYPWSVYGWLDGVNPVVGSIIEPHRLAFELAGFIDAMRRIDPRDAPVTGRTLFQRDVQVRSDIKALQEEIDTAAVTAAWEAALQLPEYDGPPVWSHSDLAPGNVLLVDDRLHAVIDFSGAGISDPSIDLQVAWNLLPAVARGNLREALNVDDHTWQRARGRALAQALVQLPYYRETNIPLATNARHVIREILAEINHAGS